MSRRDRRHAKQDAKKFTPNKKNALNKWVIVLLGVLAAAFFIGTKLIQAG